MVAPKVARPRNSRDTASERGFTLVEVTVILLVLVILSTIMLPQIGGYNRLARFVRVKEDLGAICSVIKAMLDDVGEGAIFEEAGYDHPPVRTWATGLLIGEGDKPSGPDGESEGRAKWRLDYFDMFDVETATGEEISFQVDKLGNHLIANTPMGDAGNRWRTPSDMAQGFNSLFAWRGPYMNDQISPDPWGNRYGVNVFALYSPPEVGPLDRFSSAVVCLSAGPDGNIDTDFNQPYGWTTGDDDVTALLNAGGPI